ncbi:energy coupling factor transporter S component ThiW [Lachnospiraceae bacterium YH-ros2228]|jgi:energy coupling factor transporter S component ThiW|nr:energy coupling factor transporter S component ThiW [Lachnospiraceae bacterium]MDD6448905.1 energy coupling factor transporter S component ThiW [Lachnospiraceae bacterium]
MKQEHLKKLVTSALLVAVIIALSGFYIPVGASKCFPIQHMVNVLAAVLLGPWWGVAIAFAASLIRNLMGTGSLMAFPGSMVGALCCGLMFKATKKYIPTYLAEVVGTGVLGGLLAFPVATLLMGNKEAALFTYVLPFLVSTAGGTIIAAILITALDKTKVLGHMRQMLTE